LDGCKLPAGFYVPSSEKVGVNTDLQNTSRVSAQASEFSEDVARTNNNLVLGYKKIEHEFV
jgi:hypothetical protein